MCHKENLLHLADGEKLGFHPMCLDSKYSDFSGLNGGALVRWARAGHLFLTIPHVPIFAPISPNNLEYLLAVSKNLAHPSHPVYDHGKGGGWKWWE